MAPFVWFIVLFIASWIPWGIAQAVEIKNASDADRLWLRGLMTIDVTLTIGSGIFLFLWLGWWALLIGGLLLGIGFIFESLELNPYKAIKSG